MTVFKCKMCGGNLEIEEGMSTCECEYCGSIQTVPNVDDEKKLKLYTRANRLRFNCEFDKAEKVYESIVSDFDGEAEAYWGLVLCKYGIEYVDDPSTGNKVPTCHRSSFNSIFDDEDFEMVMEYADNISKQVYRKEAKQIEELRKRIIEVSGKEEPYDIFICYKESADDGQRTIDSVLAQDVYDALVSKGYRVFFSRITLEDKIGTEYEPYIFAALNSAKVMLAFGTTYDYYDAVWVKNEWSRFLKLMGPGKEKYLIPCYKDIDAYDMPKEFHKLQSQDLGKVGATQDLIRGIEKLIGKKKEEKVIVQQYNSNEENLLNRGFLSLKNKSFDEAENFFERVLDINFQNENAYLGKLLVEYNLSTKEDLKNLDKPFDNSDNYKQILSFGSGELKSDLQEYIEFINDRNETNRKEGIYQKAVSNKNKNTHESLKEAIQLFATIKSFKNSSDLIRESLLMDKELYYQSGLKLMKANTIESFKNAIKEFNKVSDYKDSLLKIDDCKAGITEIKYQNICLLMKQNTINAYNKAISEFKKLDGYKDSEKKILECNEGIEKLKEQERLEQIEKEKAAKTKKKMTMIVSAIIAVVAVIAVVIVTVVLPAKKANQEIEIIKQCQVNDIVTFGNYNGQDIEWIVVEKSENSALLISKYILDRKEYNEELCSVTWETCTLRKWLNNEFIKDAFNSKERKLIQITKVVNDDNQEYGTDGGNDTEDKVFLLSMDEANKYFYSAEARQAYYLDNKESGMWYLRTPGIAANCVASVAAYGGVDAGGSSVCNGNGNGTRPAMWVSFE